MQVSFGELTCPYPSSQLGELRDSNDVLDQPDLLLARLAEDGYLFLRNFIDRNAVLEARQTVLSYMNDHEGLEPGSSPLDGVMGKYGKSVGMMGRRHITHHPTLKAVLEGEALFALYERLFGESARTFNYKWLRAVGHEQFTGAHYDVVYMGRGSARLMTCWVPIGDIAVEQGVLAICEGSHNAPAFEKLRRTYGKLDVDRDLTDGWFTQNPKEITDKFGGQWKTASFRAGDVLTFGMYTLHASTTNTTDRWRLSCDVRFQPATDPVDPRWAGENPVNHYGLNKGSLRPMAAARAEWGL